ncbi:pAP2 family protein [Firmicutes bacterium CAG:884]|nr:pAP2 family protein [Firmicutes bacterium CAG:884]
MKKRNIITSITLLILSVVFTLLVKNIDVKAIGPNESLVGFADINKLFHNLIGSNMAIYKITEIIGLIPLLIAFIYVIIGIKQLITRKSLLKVDKEIYLLGLFYILVLGVYIFFEKVVINYRPVLIDNILEPSYPSSHTLMSICICISSIMINKKLFRNNLADIENIISIIVMVLIIVGRIISGVHWFTDILGGIIISSTLVVLFYTILSSIKPRIEKIEF